MPHRQNDYRGRVGQRHPAWAAEMSTDAAQDNPPVIARLKASPFIPHKDAIKGLVFDVATGSGLLS